MRLPADIEASAVYLALTDFEIAEELTARQEIEYNNLVEYCEIDGDSTRVEAINKIVPFSY